LAHSLGICVVAEGIEEPEQADYLWESSCDFIQGYLYSPPLPLEKFEEWRREYENRKHEKNVT
ncbi:EAL domain-containing protein, partial [Acinetobacter baumannii]|nr:EAL domain-containing protein [Acinetobacter baumannii]